MMTDESIRAQALDPTQSFIVQAPAGSGKTTLLVKRFVNLLNLVDQPEQILAITFTRKAAQEMRNRVLEYLQQHMEAIHNKNLVEQILQQPDSLRIQTIDSFCQELVRQAPFKQMLLPGMQINENPESLYMQAAAQSLLHFLQQDKPAQGFIELLLCFDHDLPLLQKLLAQMLSKRDQWLMLGLHRSDQQDALLQWIQQTWQSLISHSLSSLNQAIKQQDLTKAFTLAHFSCSYLREKNLPKKKQISDWEYLAEISSITNETTEDLAFWQALASFLLTKSGTWRKSVTKKEGFPAASEADHPQLKQHYQEQKQAYLELVSQIASQANANELLQKLQEILLLPNQSILTKNEQQNTLTKHVLSLLMYAAANLQLLFAEHGQVDYTEFLLAAHNLLAEESALAEQLSYRIKHILVDEFQDTSVSQFYLLKQLMHSWDISMNLSLFLVGDPMQSIYRFRQADVSLFMRIWYQQLDLPVPVQPLRLQTNFRATEPLVHWTNHIFTQLLPKQADMNMGAVPYSPATAARSNQQSLTESIYCKGFHHLQQQQEYILQLLNCTKEQNQSTAILVRSRSHLADLLNQFDQHQIPYQAVELASLADQLFIRDIIHLAKAIYNPTDRLSWFCILRCPWIGLKLNQLHYLAHLHPQLWEALQIVTKEPQNHPAIDTSAYNRINLIVTKLKHILPMRFKQAWGELVMTAWDQLGGFLNLTIQQLERAEQVFALLNRYGSYAGLDFTSIEQMLNKIKLDQTHKTAQPDYTNAVQIMTIHKAKGLEFDRIIIPSLHLPTANPDPELLLFAPYQLTNQPGLLFSLNQPNKPFGNTQAYSYLRYREKQQQQLEQDRLLYVAITRAKYELHLLANLEGINETKQPRQNPEWQPPKNSFLSKIWSLCSQDFINSLPVKGM